MKLIKEKGLTKFLGAQWAKILLLAFLYFITGKLGLFLAVPPGYATIIWPPSGIAIGALIIHGWRLWPGILIGSFILNCHITNAYSWSGEFNEIKIITAFFIAAGSTLQALIGRYFVYRSFDLPLLLKNVSGLLRLFLIAGPVSCLIASSIGVCALYFSGILPQHKIFENWLTWWIGDIIGVLVFMPLVIFFPSIKKDPVLENDKANSLPALALFAVVMCLGFTFYGWKVSSETIYKQSLSDFETLAVESEKALLHRLDSYEGALLGGTGFFTGSDYVSRQEWQTYIEALDIGKSFPGINGIGYIADVKPDQISAYEQKIIADENSSFSIHPVTENRPYYIITYIEPEKNNLPAVGLNIGFEDSRVEAANLARDTGNAAITNRIILVQDQSKTPGFLLLHPMYNRSVSINTPEERRAAFRGWIYAPFIAKNFLSDLTQSQKRTLNISIYDGSNPNPENLIYSSHEGHGKEEIVGAYKISKQLTVMQKPWLVVWESTPEFEKALNSPVPLFILFGGILFTGIFVVFLLMLAAKNPESLNWITDRNVNLLPTICLIALLLGSSFLYEAVKEREEVFLQSAVIEEADEIERLISTHMHDRVMAIKRMAQRWVVSGGTSENEWTQDAANYIEQLNGLKTIEWVDSTYHVRWVHPQKGNEKAVGLNILFNESRRQALEGAAERNAMTLTPPLDLVQGYKGFIAYAPLKMPDRFDGFIVGIFNVDEFFNNIFDGEISEKCNIRVFEGKDEFYKNFDARTFVDEKKIYTSQITIFDQIWTVEISPTEYLLTQSRTWLPSVLLVCGILISLLLSLTVRYILISKIQSAGLRASEETFRSAMDYAPIGKALLNLDGTFFRVNPALCAMLGYTESELLKLDFKSITYPDDFEIDLQSIDKILKDEIQSYQIDRRYLHKDGHIVWGHLSVSLARKYDDMPSYFIIQIEDITERMEMEKMKSEFISIVSHELRTPLTSIRGSLGLIEGTMKNEISDKARHLVSLAHKNCERLILLINDILDLDKIAEGKMQFFMKKESVADLVKNGIDANTGYANKHKVSYESSTIPRNLFVEVDAARWQQIFSNLLSNAAKFSPENSKVLIYVTEKDSKIRVSVKDSGPGIPDEFRARIFTKFSQANSSTTRVKGGSGLGLNISKELVNKMNGDIGYDSVKGRGATFWFEFPAVS